MIVLSIHGLLCSAVRAQAFQLQKAQQAFISIKFLPIATAWCGILVGCVAFSSIYRLTSIVRTHIYTNTRMRAVHTHWPCGIFKTFCRITPQICLLYHCNPWMFEWNVMLLFINRCNYHNFAQLVSYEIHVVLIRRKCMPMTFLPLRMEYKSSKIGDYLHWVIETIVGCRKCLFIDAVIRGIVSRYFWLVTCFKRTHMISIVTRLFGQNVWPTMKENKVH